MKTNQGMELSNMLKGMKIGWLSLAVLFFLSACAKEGDRPERPPVSDADIRNVILLIGDGMGVSQVTAAMTVNSNRLEMLNCPVVGLQKTQALDTYVTCSAASATAMATGHKTPYYYLGMDAAGHIFENLTEQLEKQAVSVGLVTTKHITDATPAGFYAHQTDRGLYENIAKDLLHSGVDVFFGGGRDHFDQRSDGQNLLDSLQAKGFQMAYSMADAAAVQHGRLAVFLAAYKLSKWSEGRGNMLPDATRKAMDLLSQADNGFFLLVEGGQIDDALHDNDQQYMIDELLDFDRAVKQAIEFARQDGHTLVVITSDHETAGFDCLDGDLANDVVEGGFGTDDHTGSMVPVFAYGPGATAFSGVYENTAIFQKLRSAFSK